MGQEKVSPACVRGAVGVRLVGGGVGAGRGVTYEETGDDASMFGCSNVTSVEENEVSSGRLVSRFTPDDGEDSGEDA